MFSRIDLLPVREAESDLVGETRRNTFWVSHQTLMPQIAALFSLSFVIGYVGLHGLIS